MKAINAVRWAMAAAVTVMMVGTTGCGGTKQQNALGSPAPTSQGTGTLAGTGTEPVKGIRSSLPTDGWTDIVKLLPDLPVRQPVTGTPGVSEPREPSYDPTVLPPGTGPVTQPAPPKYGAFGWSEPVKPVTTPVEPVAPVTAPPVAEPTPVQVVDGKIKATMDDLYAAQIKLRSAEEAYETAKAKEGVFFTWASDKEEIRQADIARQQALDRRNGLEYDLEQLRAERRRLEAAS